MEEINILQNKILYKDYGKGHPILLLPGLDGNSNIWNNQIEELGLYFRVITIDLQHINHNFINIHNLIQLIDKFINYLQIDYFFIGGYSIGALLAISYSNRFPSNISGVLSTSLFNSNKNIEETLKYYNIDLDTNMNFLKKILSKLFNFKFNNLISYKFAYLLKYSLIINELSKIETPLLIINGQNDNLFANRIGSKFYNEKDNINFEIIENSNNNCFVSNPNYYNELVTDFIKNSIKPK